MPDDQQLSLKFSRRRKTPLPRGKKPPLTPKRNEIARLKVTLQHVRPGIWRRLEVSTALSFGSLHEILQIAFGWTDSHLHQFYAGEMRIGTIDERIEPYIGDEISAENQTRLDQILPLFDHLLYEYDFGDSWMHRIVVEHMGSREEGISYPRCTGGKRAGPPEDCGGPGGYRELIRAISDPIHDEHPSMTEWLDGSFDPDAFSADETNRQLAGLALREGWKRS
ncbi:MAG TPA: plasmid pRiA4b ORF-3 family protein [Thermoanaerobaculia bacterium]|nr:plasmid pRiA4b ORF-3 family protein [Thermoanaerobaculia bacterium]